MIGAFDGTQDPIRHLAAFRTQMMISGGNDAVKCKMLAGTLKDTALEWFTNLPFQSVRNFDDFSVKLATQFSANKKKRVEMGDLFDIKQKPRETLKEYLSRFTTAMVQVEHPEQYLLCQVFEKGLRAGHLKETLLQRKALNMDEVRARAECHIEADEVMTQKRQEESKETDRPTHRGRTPTTSEKSLEGEHTSSRS